MPHPVEDSSLSLEARLAAILQTAGCDGWLHAVDIDSGAAVDLHPINSL